MNEPTCAITIATHDRKDDLARTCAVISRLQPPPDAVVICADACADGTIGFIRAEYPSFELLVNESSLGSIGSRDRMIRHTSSDVVVSFDDDSYPLETDFIARVRKLFANPRLAVATFPQRTDEYPSSLEATDFGPSRFVGSFANSAAAIRRSIYLELGGYPTQFHHMYEEPDFALRCVGAGFAVRFETGLTVRHHYTGAQRNELRTHHLHARNELWSVVIRCPLPQLFGVAIFRLLRQFGYASTRGAGWIVREPIWWIDFLAGLSRCLTQRKPIPWRRYRAWMELVRSPITSDREWERKFRAA